jgi:hypothetical protein
MMVRQSERASHEMRCDEGARWLEEFRIWAEGFDIHTHRRDADRLDGTRDVTHGHMADRSARGQKDGIHAVVLEHLRPLRRALLHQAGNIGQPMIGVVALRQ